MKFKVGDVVTIRSDLSEGRRYHSDCGTLRDMVNTMMIAYGGRKATIERVSHYGKYVLDIDGGHWSWVDEMFVDGLTKKLSPFQSWEKKLLDNQAVMC